MTTPFYPLGPEKILATYFESSGPKGYDVLDRVYYDYVRIQNACLWYYWTTQHHDVCSVLRIKELEGNQLCDSRPYYDANKYLVALYM